ncbi:hypothetical protein [Gemmatimonas sp.]|uniref:hypothetical protein n=1 Tax=Gemmatimonas sp. TaxID=1962908 RepID=UPI00286BC845|nr:hypothetical protein [Gemmatimonas sp.]
MHRVAMAEQTHHAPLRRRIIPARDLYVGEAELCIRPRVAPRQPTGHAQSFLIGLRGVVERSREARDPPAACPANTACFVSGVNVIIAQSAGVALKAIDNKTRKWASTPEFSESGESKPQAMRRVRRNKGQLRRNHRERGLQRLKFFI